MSDMSFRKNSFSVDKSRWNYVKPKVNFDIRYIVDDKNNAIVCYVRPLNPVFVGYNYWDGTKKDFKGVATYKAGDTYSEEQGKSIARKKALRNFWRTIMSWGKNINEVNEKAVETTEMFIAHCSDNVREITNEIKKEANAT